MEEYQRIGDLGLQKTHGTGQYEDERVMRRRDGAFIWCRVRGQSLELSAPFSRLVWSYAGISEHRPVTGMTGRERQVAKMMAEVLTSKEIARAWHIAANSRGATCSIFGEVRCTEFS